MNKKIFSLFTAIIILCSVTLFSGCADSKTFKKSDGTEFTAHAYGWFDRDYAKIEGVEYEICAGNLVWSIFTCETIVGPIIITGVGLYEPVSYTEPKKTN
jgi:hypothetical protein